MTLSNFEPHELEAIAVAARAKIMEIQGRMYAAEKWSEDDPEETLDSLEDEQKTYEDILRKVD